MRHHHTRLCRALIAILTALLPLVAGAQSTRAHPPLEREMLDAMRAAASAKLAAAGDRRTSLAVLGPPQEDRLIVKNEPLLQLGKLRVRSAALPGMMDWQHYLMGDVDGRLYRLGGFGPPSTAQLAQLLKESGTRCEATTLRVIARLFDPNGRGDWAAEAAAAVGSGQVPITSLPDTARLVDYLRDSAHWAADSSLVVRIAFMTRTYGVTEVPQVVSTGFACGRDGSVHAVSQYVFDLLPQRR
ncbi:MAG: hypothetical protein HY275_07565 [Gemmatimonadetes bacterium]|nr:hypothetical protein [Gemmatimonadota bacterium]